MIEQAVSRAAKEEQGTEEFVAALEMRTRLAGSHHALLSFDRLACPMPGTANMQRFKQATLDITQFAAQLEAPDQTRLKSMMSVHIKTSVEHLKLMKAEASQEDKQA